MGLTLWAGRGILTPRHTLVSAAWAVRGERKTLSTFSRSLEGRRGRIEATLRPPRARESTGSEARNGTMTTITKKDLVERISERTKIGRAEVKQSVQMFLDMVILELKKGNRLEFRDFGVFEVKERAARLAQNPKTMQKVQVPAKRAVKFKVGRLMRESVELAPPGQQPLPEVKVVAGGKVSAGV
ncbi:MAG: HU family DNA-binding protein [Phycisphaerales bacterium]